MVRKYKTNVEKMRGGGIPIEVKPLLLVANVSDILIYITWDIRCGMQFTNLWKIVASILSEASKIVVFSSATLELSVIDIYRQGSSR